MSFKAQVDEALAAGDGDRLATLLSSAANKAERKVVKKAIYLAGQRGVVVPEASAEAAPGAALKAAPLVVMMGPPQRDAGRLFTIPLVTGGGVEVVELYFEMPQGIERLQSAVSTRGQYVPWQQKMCTASGGALPSRVPVPAALAQRKLAELHHCERRDLFGSDVNRSLATRLANMVSANPPHPARSLAVDAAPLSVEELGQRSWGLAAFEHASPMEMFRLRITERGRVWAGDDSPVTEATREWAAEWGAEKIEETLLDCAAWAWGLSDAPAAATYLKALDDPENFVARAARYLAGA